MQPRCVMLLNDETVAALLSDLARRLRRLIESAFPLVFLETHWEGNSGSTGKFGDEFPRRPEFPFYNIRMGRMRIKKKGAVIPFRETLAYRMIFAGASLIVFVVALYNLVGALSTSPTRAIASGAIGVAAAFGIFYNLDHLREAKIPKRTLHRMKRR